MINLPTLGNLPIEDTFRNSILLVNYTWTTSDVIGSSFEMGRNSTVPSAEMTIHNAVILNLITVKSGVLTQITN